MVFFLGISLGIIALMLRSVVALAGVGLMIIAAFAGAALFSSGNLHVLPLLIALAAFNIGITGGFVALVAREHLRMA